MSVEAYQRCLRALDVAAFQHDSPEGLALVASVRQTVLTVLAAEDPSLLHEILIDPPAPKRRRYPNKSNCGPSGKRLGRLR